MGPLQGYRVIELAGIGPCPMTGMMLADMGADVIRVERSSTVAPRRVKDVSLRGKKSIVVNLKKPGGTDALLRVVDHMDVLLEGFRPGVAERLGIGPEVCLQRNARLVYGRVTGWGQSGPLAKAAGHDINYIAIIGALHAIGRNSEPPVPPLNLLGDMAGGGMLLAFGVVAALLEAQRSGRGQVVDAAMTDGVAQLMWPCYGLEAAGFWNAQRRGVNMLDGGAHFYNTYETQDGKFIAIGAIEPQFYALLVQLIGADAALFKEQNDAQRWLLMKGELAAIFKTKTREEWCRILEGTDACFAPVLSMLEAPAHPHNRARGTFLTLDGFVQPSPAPRFSRTAPQVRHGQHPIGADGEAVLTEAGLTRAEIEALRRNGALS
jgi:alpha-methylacyl-CoA racemase